MPTSPWTEVVARGWESFLNLRYRESFATGLSVFGLSQGDFQAKYFEEASERQAITSVDDGGFKHVDRDVLIDGLELLIEAGAVIGSDVGAFEFACDLAGVPRGFWEFVDPFLAEDVSGMQHSASVAFDQGAKMGSEAGNEADEKSAGYFDVRLAGQRELLAQLLLYVHAIATPLKLSTVGLLPTSISESHREQILQLAKAISPPSSCVLSFDRLTVNQQDRLRCLLIRSMIRCGLSSRSFAVLRGSFSEVFQHSPDCLPSSVPIAGAASRLESLCTGRHAVAEVRWLHAAFASGRLHNPEWMKFGGDLLLDAPKGESAAGERIEIITNDLLARPPHRFGEDFRSALLILRSTQGLAAARGLAENLQAKLLDCSGSLSRHVSLEVLRVSSEWGFDSNLFRSRVIESIGTDRLGFGKRRAVAGFSIIELMRQKHTAESLDYYINELRSVIDSEEKLGNQPLACTLRIRRAEAMVAIGEWSDAMDEVARMLPFDASSDVLDDIVEKLWDGHVLFEEPMTALMQFCRSIAALISIGTRRKEHAFIDQIRANARVSQCLCTLDIDSTRRVMHPVYFVETVWARLRCLNVLAPDTVKEFTDAVHVILDMLANDVVTDPDRRLFIASALKIRSLICEVAEWTGSIASPESSTAEIVLCLELLDHRLKLAPSDNAEIESISSENIIPQGSRGTRHEPSQSTYAQQHAYFSRLTEFEYEEPDETDSSEYSGNVVGTVHEGCSHELEQSVSRCLGRTGLWIKTLFLSDGQLRWWAFKPNDFNDRLSCVANGGSSPGAKRRIELETAVLDATLEAIWSTPNSAESFEAEMFWAEVDLSGYLTNKLLRLIKVPDQFGAVEREEILHGASRALIKWRARLSRKAVQKLPDCFKVAEQLLAAYIVDEQVALDRLTTAWSRIIDFVGNTQKRQLIQSSTQLDDALNAACRRHREAISRDLCFAPLAEILSDSPLDVLISMDGPLASCPVEWLCVADRPLYVQTSSCTSLTSIRRALALAAGPNHHRSSRELFAAMWEPDETRRQTSPLHKLNSDLHDLASEYDWKCRTAFDAPLASKTALEATLCSVPFDAVVIAGHGVARVKRKSYRYGIHIAHTDADQSLPSGESKKVSRSSAPDNSSSSPALWTGLGDFSATAIVVLCSCDVGRTLDDRQSGFHGLYEELMANGAQCVCGARWAVRDDYAVDFAIEITRGLFECVSDCEGDGPFGIARMLNRVRKRFLRERPKSEHAISAFSLWGIARERAGVPDSAQSDSETGCNDATVN